MTISYDKWAHAWDFINSSSTSGSAIYSSSARDHLLYIIDEMDSKNIELCNKGGAKMAGKLAKTKKVLPNKTNPIISIIQKVFPDVSGEIRISYGYSYRFDRFINTLGHINIIHNSIFDIQGTAFTSSPGQCKGIILMDLLEFYPDKNAMANEIYRSCVQLPRGCPLLIGVYNHKRSLYVLLRAIERKYMQNYKCNIGLLALGDSYVFMDPAKLVYEDPGNVANLYVYANLVKEDDVLKSMWMANINNISRIENAYIPGMTLFIGSI